jgi:CMP-N,N'-diacetyllegionaminic acid synthase
VHGRVALSKKLDNTIVRRQDAPKSYDMNASIYIWTREALLNQTTFFTDGTGLYVMPENRSIDIDSELDFEFVEFMMRKKYAK